MKNLARRRLATAQITPSGPRKKPYIVLGKFCNAFVTNRRRSAGLVANAGYRKARLGLCVPGVMPLNAFWQQAFPTTLAPSCESCSTTFGAHARTKSVLAFACSLRCLVSAFHNRDASARELGAATVGIRQRLSIALRATTFDLPIASASYF